MLYCNNVHGYIKQSNVNNKKKSIFKPFSELCLIFVFKTNLTNKSKTLSEVWSSTYLLTYSMEQGTS
jgi:hypothetical protein